MESSKKSEKLPFINAVYFNSKEDKFCINFDDMSKFLLNDSIKDKNVVVISVAGAYRKGKSFLLNFFIKYLKCIQDDYEKFTSENFNEADFEWMGDQVLEGFPWRGGSERETDGILIWGEPFIIKLPTGESLVVLLMDTQGAFDNSSTVKDCATIFAISTMLSSYQIYNISYNVQENDLDHLQLFTEYGRVALEASIFKPFQDLMFLVRDWPYPYEFDYGNNEFLLSKKLQINEDQPQELQSVRRHIRNCFENVYMFLLPHPGLNVATSPKFKGTPNELDDAFKEYLSRLSHFVLSPSRLKAKLCQGNLVTCKDLLAYFRAYINIFQSDTLPEPKSMLMATAEANHLVALNSSKSLYEEKMTKFCGGDAPYILPSEILKKHNEYVELALLNFNSIKKMGSEEFSKSFKEQLTSHAQSSYEEFLRVNASKQVSSLKFIILAVILCIFSFLISNILDVVGLDVFMLPFNIFSLLCILGVLFCLYGQFIGGFPQIIYLLDKSTDRIINQAKDFAITKYLESKRLIEHSKKN